MKKKVITKAELKEIQKYWWQAGGFGGTLSSGIKYYSETTHGRRFGIMTFYAKNGEYDTDIVFFHQDTIEEIEHRIEMQVGKSGCALDKDFNLIKGIEKMKYAEKKEEIRQQAINFQYEIISEKITDFGEIEEKRTYFEKVGKKYGLIKEFRENAII